jgi:hypothetical protein
MISVHADSLWAATVGENMEHRRLIAELCLAGKLPSAFGWRENVEAGGPMSYGNDVIDTFRGLGNLRRPRSKGRQSG